MAFIQIREMHALSNNSVLLGRKKCLYNKSYEDKNYYTQEQKERLGQHREYLLQKLQNKN
jgi:hypothetical protein